MGLSEELRTVVTGLLTPFDDDLAVDYEALAANAQTIADQGVAALFVCGNVSEYHSLSRDERVRVTETARDAVPNMTILAGAGGNTPDAIDQAQSYESIGADGILVMPPSHTYLHERGLIRYYRKIAASIDIPIVPYLRGFEPSVDFVADLTHVAGVIAIKWTIPDVPRFAAVVRATDSDFTWMNGLGEPYVIPFHVEGATSHASGIGNFQPIVAKAMADAIVRDDRRTLDDIRSAAAPLMAFRERPGSGNTLPGGLSIPTLKAASECAGLVGGRVREPLVELTDAERMAVVDRYEELMASLHSHGHIP